MGSNTILYQDAEHNAVRYSRIQKIEAPVSFGAFGIKYVASGEEVYHINDKKFVVREGQYMIGNQFTAAHVAIDQQCPAQGICIDISPKIITDVAEYHQVQSDELIQFLLSEQFFVNRYNIQNTSLGYTLHEINRKIQDGSGINDLCKNELFYSLAESIVNDQRFVFDHLNKMDFKKYATNEEVFRAVLKARSMMDEQTLYNFTLEELSTAAGISKYHFIRIFKNTFGISPFQYQKKKRLAFAKAEIQKGIAIADAAIKIGYPDVHSFTKAFKQCFGITPGTMKKAIFDKNETAHCAVL